MNVFLCDLEGVFIPEVWINFAERTGIEELKLTTRDIQDYSELMKYRINILNKNNLKLSDIKKVISDIKPLPGAKEFLENLKEYAPVHIVSDTFIEFADPLMEQLGRPSLFCNSLVIENDKVIDIKLRQKDQKRLVVEAFQGLQYKVLAFGDSYNDISMLEKADYGFLFKPSGQVMEDYPNFPVANDYDELKELLLKNLNIQ